jgi:hypothetical protein
MDDDEGGRSSLDPRKGDAWTEFDCPSCDANNPMGEGFKLGDEVVCMFCGVVWDVKEEGDDDDGRFRLVEA